MVVASLTDPRSSLSGSAVTEQVWATTTKGINAKTSNNEPILSIPWPKVSDDAPSLLSPLCQQVLVETIPQQVLKKVDCLSYAYCDVCVLVHGHVDIAHHENTFIHCNLV